jgi:hypothetical protein
MPASCPAARHKTLCRALCRADVDNLGVASSALCDRLAAAVPLGTVSREFAAQFLAAPEAMDALTSNLRAVRALLQDFRACFCQQARRACTPWQALRCLQRRFD